MPEHNDSNAREAKRKALARLLALCPRGEEAESLMGEYLDAASRIPPALYAKACAHLIATWDDTFTYPRPAHIRAAMRTIIRDHEEQRLLEANEQTEREAMTPGQARRLLLELDFEPKPDPSDSVKVILRKLRESTLRRAAARDSQPQLVEGEEEHERRDPTNGA